MPMGNPLITLPLLRLPWCCLWTSHAACCGRVPFLINLKNPDDVGPYHSGRFSNPVNNRFKRSDGLKPNENTSDSATATACRVSSVNWPALRKWRPPGSISVIHAPVWADPSSGAPIASPIASPASDPGAFMLDNINLTNKVYLSNRKIKVYQKR